MSFHSVFWMSHIVLYFSAEPVSKYVSLSRQRWKVQVSIPLYLIKKMIQNMSRCIWYSEYPYYLVFGILNAPII